MQEHVHQEPCTHPGLRHSPHIPGQGVANEKPICPHPRSPQHTSLPFPTLKGPSLPPVLYWSPIMIFLPA